MTSICHLLQFLAIGVYAIIRRDVVRGILRDRPVARGWVVNEMSQIEELEYKRAAFQILSSILAELVPDFWKTLIDQWEQEGRPGVSPVDRQYPLDELSKMATEWLLTRNTLQ
jgi:hypothetical protein